MNNLGAWRLAPRGEHPVVDGSRLVYVGRDGVERGVDLGVFSTTRGFQDVKGSGIGMARQWEPEGQTFRHQRDDGSTWSIGGHGFGYTYFRPPTRSKMPAEHLLTESVFISPWPHDMVCLGGRYLACELGPYVVVADPETRTIYRVAEGSKLHVLVNDPPTSRPEGGR